MSTIAARLTSVRTRIHEATARYGRDPAEVQLLAVSKVHPAEALREAHAVGQATFGESYLQEALDKQARLADLPLEWHFIGHIQSNKTRPIAENFAWVHGVDSLRIARRLSDQRPEGLPPLNLCLQVNIDDETSKSGVPPEAAGELVGQIAELPRVQLRGLMTLPAPAEGLAAQRVAFARLRELRDRLARPGLPLATLSMGMSDDLEAAIAEGSTILRIGTAIFGSRR